MDTALQRTPIALFAALTRAVRDAPVSAGVRARAYENIDRMAHAVNQSGFAIELEALISFASGEPLFLEALQPFWKDLRALSDSPP